MPRTRTASATSRASRSASSRRTAATGCARTSSSSRTRGSRSSSIPGQGLPLFSGPELLEMIDAATFLAVNDYEGACWPSAPGLSLEAIAGARRGADRDARRRRLAHPRRRARIGASGGEAGGARRSDRLRRCLPRGPAVRHRPAAGTGSAPGASRRCWARSRSRAAAGRITPSAATRWRAYTSSSSRPIRGRARCRRASCVRRGSSRRTDSRGERRGGARLTERSQRHPARRCRASCAIGARHRARRRRARHDACSCSRGSARRASRR